MLDIVQLGSACVRWMVRRGEPKIFNSSVSIAISHLYRPAADERGGIKHFSAVGHQRKGERGGR